jgi:2-dehydro-3-deoxy-L-rhamnonate dehydrogenase (NAD+)
MTGIVSDKVAIVTGAGRGIGRGIAIAYAREGANVVVASRTQSSIDETVSAIRADGGSALGIACDVGRRDDVFAAVAKTVAAFGTVDILVNNAGIAGPNVKTWEYDPAAWAEVMRVNLDSQFYCCRSIVPLMIAQNYGRIVNVASIAGKEGNLGMAAYSASKAGLIGLVKSMGKDYAESGVTVNALAPAVIRTPMVDSLPRATIDYMTQRIPMRRCGELLEVAAAIAWIISPACSFTTGFTFDLSGGRAVY